MTFSSCSSLHHNSCLISLSRSWQRWGTRTSSDFQLEKKWLVVVCLWRVWQIKFRNAAKEANVSCWRKPFTQMQLTYRKGNHKNNRAITLKAGLHTTKERKFRADFHLPSYNSSRQNEICTWYFLYETGKRAKISKADEHEWSKVSGYSLHFSSFLSFQILIILCNN